LLLLILYVVANKFRPSFDVEMPVVRRTVRRPAPAVTQ
jgi:hypothetical protein